jgi:2-oxoglutarate ferredoxin oxidoreductase subunit beta
VIVHDAHRPDPSYAFALSRLDSEDFTHAPIGIFRQVQRPSYDTLMAQQIEAAQARQGGAGPGMDALAGLLASGDTWEIS